MAKKLIISGIVLVTIGLTCFGWSSLRLAKHEQNLQVLNPTNDYWNKVDSHINDQNSLNPVVKAMLSSNMKLKLQEEYEHKAGQNQTADLVYAISLVLIIAGFGVFLLITGEFVVKFFMKIFKKKNEMKSVFVELNEENLMEPETIDENETILDDSFKAQPLDSQQWQSKKKYASSMNTIYNPEKQKKTSIVSTMQDQNSKIEQMIKEQFSSLEKQITEVKTMANDSAKTEVEETKEYDKTLTQLTRQVAAINEFASKQQEKVKKLQEGYDWNIIKNFTIRIIRCIDNLEATIEAMTNNNEDTTILEDTRDDFLFALESSGVEQYKPELNSEYRGQEKFAEAISQRQVTPEQMLKGKIANIIRPGYKFMIDDENFKIVRTSQVKLYG